MDDYEYTWILENPDYNFGNRSNRIDFSTRLRWQWSEGVRDWRSKCGYGRSVHGRYYLGHWYWRPARQGDSEDNRGW